METVKQVSEIPALNEIVQNIENVFKIIDRYQNSRPGSIAFTKLEEAILWLQVMVHNIPVKENVAEPLAVETNLPPIVDAVAA
jgi:hypothetical protein